MNRFVLGLLGLAAVVGLAVYFLGNHDAPPAPPAAPGSAASPAIVRDHVRGPRPALPATVTPAPHAADHQTGSADEYTVGGVQVRDHRGGDSPHMDIPPSIHPPEAHQLSSAIVNDVAQQVRAVMKQCAAALPPGARGGAPRLQGQLVVAIKDHQLTVTGATMQLRDVTGDALEPTRQCMEQRSIGLQTSAADEPDVDHYAITVNFALP